MALLDPHLEFDFLLSPKNPQKHHQEFIVKQTCKTGGVQTFALDGTHGLILCLVQIQTFYPSYKRHGRRCGIKTVEEELLQKPNQRQRGVMKRRFHAVTVLKSIYFTVKACPGVFLFPSHHSGSCFPND